MFLTSLACSITNRDENENLPKGMVDGLWISPNGGYSFIFFDDEYFAAGEGEYGTYQLMNDGTLLLQGSDFSERWDISMSKSKERIILSNEDSDDIILDLVWENESSGNLERDIVGE